MKPQEAEGQANVEEPAEADALPARAETLKFIRAHSPHGDYDLLPGIIFFTECWLTKVMLTSPVTNAAAAFYTGNQIL